MYSFEVGVAARKSNAPEVRHFVEASSMQEAIREVTHRCGGADVALVTFAHYGSATGSQAIAHHDNAALA
jgi:hypothetical protein